MQHMQSFAESDTSASRLYHDMVCIVCCMQHFNKGRLRTPWIGFSRPGKQC